MVFPYCKYEKLSHSFTRNIILFFPARKNNPKDVKHSSISLSRDKHLRFDTSGSWSQFNEWRHSFVRKQGNHTGSFFRSSIPVPPFRSLHTLPLFLFAALSQWFTLCSGQADMPLFNMWAISVRGSSMRGSHVDSLR